MKQKTLFKENNNQVGGIQNVSALYSEHVYRTVKKNFVYQTEIEKYRMMFEVEKRQKRKLIKEVVELKEKQKKMIDERQIFSFALDTLACKINDENNEKMLNLCDQLDTQEKKEPKETQEQVNKGKEGQTQKSQQMNKSKMNFIKKIKMDFELQKPSQATNKNSENEQLQSELQSCQEQIFCLQKEKDSLLTQIENLQGSLKLHEEELNSKREKISSLKSIIKEKDTIIEGKIKDAIELHEKSKESNQTILNLRTKLAEERKKNIDLESELKITQESYQERQEKQKDCLKKLQSFSKQLKLNDEKVKEFIHDNFENYQENQTSTKTYHEHLSYVLHLYKKKENLYEDCLEELRNRIRESDLRTLVFEKKLNKFFQYNKSLLKGIEDNQPEKEFVKNVKRIVKEFNK